MMDIGNMFFYDHLTEDVRPLGAIFYDLAKKIETACPDGEDKDRALKKLYVSRASMIYSFQKKRSLER